MTQNAAAFYCGVGQATVSDIINKDYVPKVETLFRLADYFATPRQRILEVAGLLDPDHDDIDPEIRATIEQLHAIWRRLKETNPDAAKRLQRIAILQAEMVEAAAGAREPNPEPVAREPQPEQSPAPP